MKLLIRNLDRSISEATLLPMFEKHGAVQYCTVVMDKKTSKSKGFAFVEMPKVGEAKAAMPKVLVCTVIGGVWLEFQEPVGWTWEGSLSEGFAFAQTEDVDKSFTYVGEEENVEVYRNELTGRPAFVGRTGTNQPHDPEDESIFIVD